MRPTSRVEWRQTSVNIQEILREHLPVDPPCKVSWNSDLTRGGGMIQFQEQGHSADSKIESTSPVTSDSHEISQGRSEGEYLQIHRRDFQYLLSR